MRFIHLGDLHIGRTFDMHSLLDDQRFVLEQVLDLAQQRKPDFVLIAGDIYDRSVPKEEAVALYDEFITRLVLELGIPVYAISGNHDSSRRLEGLGGLLKKTGYHMSGTLKNPLEQIQLMDDFGPVDLYFLPYKEMHGARAIYEITDTKETKATMERILASAQGNPNRKILMTHNYFGHNASAMDLSDSERRISIGGEDIIDTSVLDAFQYVALGHLHKPQRVGREEVRYAGSLLKYSTSEVDHRKVITWVEMDELGSCQVELIPVTFLRDLKKIQGSYHDFLHSDFVPQKNDFLALVLTDEERIDHAYVHLSSMYPNIISLTYLNMEQAYELKVDQEAIRKADLRKLFNDFFKDKNHREMNDDEEVFMADIFREVEADNDTN